MNSGLVESCLNGIQIFIIQFQTGFLMPCVCHWRPHVHKNADAAAWVQHKEVPVFMDR